MEFTTILDTRKSIRSFTGENISEKSLKNILHAANVSPVGMGKYDSIHLTVVKDKNILAEIEKTTANIFKVENRSFLYGAPELIIISTSATDNVGYSNAAIIAHDMVLAAVNENVGACHIWGCMIALSTNPELMKKLSLPEGFTPTCAVALGKTEDTYTEREIPEERININYI